MTADREKDGLLPGTAPSNAAEPPDEKQLPPGAPAVGEVIAGKYRIERVLGAGGMGVVVAAHHLQLDTRVAIKFLLPATLRNSDAVARFSREARAAVRITSEHVARVLDVGTLESGAPYIVMEFLEGTDLSARLRSQGQLTIEEAVEEVLQTCEALAEAHALGIVHRDLKPANLFCIRRPDGLPWIKVLDFGISKLVGDSHVSSHVDMTQSAVVMGSPAYMSPEQMQSARNVDVRSDIWALGVVLFELLAGWQPFQGESFAEVVLQVAGRPAPSLREARRDCPAALEQVIFQCLEKDRDKRFPDIAALAVALLPFAPERARASVERITRAAQRSGQSMTVTGPGFVSPSLGAPGGPLQTLTALGHTTSRPRVAARPFVWVAGAVIAGSLVLVASIKLGARKAEPSSIPSVSPAARAPEALPSVRPLAEEPLLLPPPASATVSAPPTGLPSAPPPRSSVTVPQPRPSVSLHPQPTRPASSTQSIPKHEDIF